MSCWQDLQTEEIYNINTLLLILSTGIVLFSNLMHQKSDKSILIKAV